MRARERPLISFPALPGLTLTSRLLIFLLLVLVSVTQCPGLVYRKTMKQPKCVMTQLALLSPLREKGIRNTEGRGVRKNEKKRVRHLFMMGAGPVSAQETHPVPVFQCQVTQSDPQDSDPISSMRMAVYPPPESVGNSAANDNSPFQIGLGSREFLGLYKPAVPDQQHDTWAYSSAANSSEIGPPSHPRTSAAHSSNSRTRTGIVYPLQPRSRRPDVCIQAEASLPEPAALLRPDLRQPESPTAPREVPTNLPRTHKRLSRKRRRNRSTALYCPAKRSPPRGQWCDQV